MRDPIIITGCARSGTSLSAGILNICGAFGGDMYGPTKFNQKGMFENKKIRQAVSKPYLDRIGCDPLGQNPLPNKHQVFSTNSSDAKVFRSQVEKIIREQGYKDGPWFYKGAKSCLVWYHWHLAFPNAIWVIVRRNTNDIVNSCLKTSFMKAYNDVNGWKKWVAIHERRFEEMKVAGLKVIEFWPIKAINGDFEYVENYVKSVDPELHWNQREVIAFIDPALYHEVANG